MLNDWLNTFLFWPFIGGLLMALLLGLGGAAFFLKGSAWQGLALAQMAATGGLVASVLAWPLVPAALGFAGVLTAVLQNRKEQERLSLAAFLAALAMTTLLASNFSQASLAAARWMEGQVYFLAGSQVAWVVALAGVTLTVLPWVYRVWLLSQLGADRGWRLPAGRRLQFLDVVWRLLLVVLGSLTLGLPAALVCLLLPAWTAAMFARGLKSFFLLSVVFSLTAFLLAWVIALRGDQPFAPVLVLVAMVQGGGLYALKLILRFFHPPFRTPAANLRLH